jgi:hypothetical protein
MKLVRHHGLPPIPVWLFSRKFLTAMGVVSLHISAACLLIQMPYSQQQQQTAAGKAVTVFLMQDSVDAAELSTRPNVQRQPDRESTLAASSKPSLVSPALPAAPLVMEPPREAVGAAISAEPAAPLNLQLPKGWEKQIAPRHPALEAGAGPRQLPTLENRIANALGGGSWIEERLGDGRLRMRNGNKCIYRERNRADDLNPFNALPTPALLRQEAC